MLRQRALIAALVAGLTVTALATAERATYILTTGERISGMVAFHGDDRLNVIDNQFGIARDNGKDIYVPRRSGRADRFRRRHAAATTSWRALPANGR